MLRDVFAECVRMLEPGGRIAVNVANLGRRPYRRLAADVIDDLAGRARAAAAGRDHLEQGRGRKRLDGLGIVPERRQPGAARHQRAHRGREQGSLRPRAYRRSSAGALGLPFESTTDDRRLHGADARRLGRFRPRAPAASGILRRSRSRCPSSCIGLFTFRDDVVLDPFMGSGSHSSLRRRSTAATWATTSTRRTSKWPRSGSEARPAIRKPEAPDDTKQKRIDRSRRARGGRLSKPSDE